ncbi:SRPBCC family protein [Natronoglycomyces albus]|uniref:SRPBCC family protein n=1 Tax=Natronoglycomyces albus TaxID=2811108 RepID=A0A895XFM8_9ACTN|nr:SRPBCC family protein [Natronoglycomyces albus]QSB04651.1 SRPBCC family protein [Natronoglycomyces albus]
MNDLMSYLNDSARHIHDGPKGGFIVSLSHVYKTDLEDLWDACTNPQRLPRWFLPVTGDLSVGGHYQLEGNASGTIKSCEPPRALLVSWEFDDKYSELEALLESEGEHARLTLKHFVPDDEHWAEFGPAATGIGWDMALGSLAAHTVGTEFGRSPEWFESDEAVSFMSQSAQQWTQAHIDSGADIAEAKAMAARTINVYTGGQEGSERE